MIGKGKKRFEVVMDVRLYEAMQTTCKAVHIRKSEFIEGCVSKELNNFVEAVKKGEKHEANETTKN